MIQKQLVGTGFRGLLNYVFRASRELDHGQARIVDTNMAARTPRGLASEFGAFRALNPRVTKPVYHCSLRLPEGEQLTASQWAGFTREYLAGMGFTDTPYLAVSHAEGHVHLIVCRVRADGSTVRDSFTHRRSNTLVHVLEERYGLSHAVDPERPRASRGHRSRDAQALAERLGEYVPSKVRLAQAIDTAIARSDGTRERFIRALDEQGVTAHWNVASSGRVHGASYELRDAAGHRHPVLKGSQLGTPYAWSRLEVRLAARAGAMGPSHDGAQGRPAAGSDREPAVAGGVAGEPPTAATTEDRQRTPGPRREQQDSEVTRPQGAEEEVPVPATRAGRQDQDVLPLAARGRDGEADPTLAAVFTQLVGMDCRRYEVGIRAPEQGMVLRTWDGAAVLRAVPWLKAMNARNHDIYIRPEGSAGLVLVDDLQSAALDRLKLDGLAPAAVTETSPGNHQAWVRLSREPMPAELATAAARELAERYGGDAKAADWRHFGRLAGFTNRKPKHTRLDGRQPYVRVLEAPGRAAPVAHRLLERAQERLERARPAGQLAAPPPDRPLERAMSRGDPDPSHLGREYQRRAERLLERSGDADASRVDWMVCRQLMERYPELRPDDLRQAMRTGSPRLEERKGRHLDEYLDRTVTKAFGAARLQPARERLPERDRRER